MLKNISKIKPNPDNPRIIEGHKFKLLVKSIRDFPEMLELRPIVVDENMQVLGGNMRLKACKEAGLKKVPISIAEGLSEEQKKEFIIKDNVGFGEWDWEMLNAGWDTKSIGEWGLDLPVINEKLEVEQGLKPEIEVTQEVLEEHNYVVFTFDNTLDWQVVKEFFNIGTVIKPNFTETYKQTGVGRVKSGQELIELINRSN